AGLALTTARYYTPSGRLIQRPWDGTFDEYLTYTLRDQDAKREHKPADLKRTDSGREVYAGGGIEPDKYFPGPVEGFNPTRFGRSLFARFAFQDYAQQFQAEGDTRFQGGHRRSLGKNFEVDDAMISDFKKFLTDEEHVRIDDEAFNKDREFI